MNESKEVPSVSAGQTNVDEYYGKLTTVHKIQIIKIESWATFPWHIQNIEISSESASGFNAAITNSITQTIEDHSVRDATAHEQAYWPNEYECTMDS